MGPASCEGLLLAGYVVGHYKVKLAKPSENMKIKVNTKPYSDYQLAAFYGPIGIVDDILRRPILVPYWPHITHPLNQVVAAVHRFGRQMPEPTADHAERFLSFSKVLIPMIWPDRLRDEDVPSVVEWLSKTSYSGGRKEQLYRLFKSIEHTMEKFAESKSFIKDEAYWEPKNARAINSPTDESKTILGPLFRAIDKQTFKAKYFVKGTNPRDWPKRLYDTLGDSAVTETDFSAFESHHSGIFSEVVYFWMSHMIKDITRIRPMRDLLAKLVLGRNHINFKHIQVDVDQRLMSGSLWTSSANGVLNLMIMMYLASLSASGSDDPNDMADWAHSNFVGFVEGDDGLCIDYGIRKQDIEGLGCVLDMEPHANFTEANFCGIVCDSQNLVVLKDPLPALAKLFLLPAKYRQSSKRVQRALYRARALSYLCNFSSTPVLAAACHWILRRTHTVDITRALNSLDAHHREFARLADHELREQKNALRKLGATGVELDVAGRVEIDIASRRICELRFGISIADQLAYERVFDTCESDMCNIDFKPYVEDVMLAHGEDFLYKEGSVPKPPPCDTPVELLEILDVGLTPAQKSRCQRADKLFRRMCGTAMHVNGECRTGD